MQLKILRVMANMTQAEAAAAVGVTQAALSDWENGKYKPNPTAVTKLAEAYRVTEAEVVQAVVDTMEKANEATDGEDTD